ncbi:hypothetical protein PQX77_004962 [Marasmius sp. AFHP31]|nr:hypothetical protein PQX77_004962 [Marasmius sp. AFHP31]
MIIVRIGSGVTPNKAFTSIGISRGSFLRFGTEHRTVSGGDEGIELDTWSNGQNSEKVTVASTTPTTTDDFRGSLALAKSLATGLPGGELLIEDQDDVIDMLVTLRDRKREQLGDFSSRASVASSTARDTTAELKMEVDSMASTPFHES